MSFESDLREGIAAKIDAMESRDYKWRGRNAGDYAEGELPIVMGRKSDLYPNQIVISDYPVADDFDANMSVIGIQFRFIGELGMGFVDRAKSDVFDLFHGLGAGTLGSVKVVMAERRSGAVLGQESSSRVEETANYYFTVHRPSPNRT